MICTFHTPFKTGWYPEELDYIIPGNDDAIRAVKLIVSKMADAVVEANQGAEADDYTAEAEAEKVEEE